MRSRIAVVLASTLVVALAIAGCGGKSGKSFETQANDICKSYKAKIKAVPEPQDPSEVAGYFDKTLPLTREATAKLKALDPPSSKQAAYDEYVSLLEQETSLLDQLASAARAGDSSAVDSVQSQYNALSDQDADKARQLGLKECVG